VAGFGPSYTQPALATASYRGGSDARSRTSLVRGYLCVVGIGLLAQGAASLLVEAVHGDAHGTTRLLSDPRHAAIHLVWGALTVGVLALGALERVLAVFAVAFGVFYIALLVLGVAVHHPFGLMLDRDENVFHAIIGPLALLVGFRSLYQTRASREPTVAARQ